MQMWDERAPVSSPVLATRVPSLLVQTWGKRHESIIVLELALVIQEIGGIEMVRVLELGRILVRRHKQGNHKRALGVHTVTECEHLTKTLYIFELGT